VTVDMITVSVGADQNTVSIKVFSQLQSGGMSRNRIHIGTLRMALNHVIEHRTVRFMVQ